MLLKNLIENCPENLQEIYVGNIAFREEQCTRDTLFFRLGDKYSEAEAIKRGACCIVTENPAESTVPVIAVNSVRKALAYASAGFYGNPQNSMRFAGITGTNGKTTTSFMLASILSCAGIKTGIIGTLGAYIGREKIFFGGMTTPDPPELFRTLDTMRRRGVECVVMEVSAHALALEKTEPLFFDVAAFTNLGRDHMDFFGDKAHYAAAKEKLFGENRRKYAVINADDEEGRKIIAEYPSDVITYGLENPSDVFAVNESHSLGGVRFIMNLCDEIVKISCALPGRFNVYNALCAAAAAGLMGASTSDIADGLKKLGGIPGRFNVISGVKSKIIIDFAHTAESLKNAIISLRGCCDGKIVAVFGCGGDRDRTKRPEMGKAASENADFCVITSDNPRSEKPESIIKEICAGIGKNNYAAIPDRREAIRYALECAGDNGVVLIAGKGGENYQEINGVRYEYSDEEYIRSLIEKKVIK